LPRPSLARRCLAEALATFALVFAGCGAIVVDAERGGSLGAFGIAAAFGLVIMAVATDTRAVGAAAAIAIGGTVALDSLYGGGVTGASKNPAGSLGPALAASSWADIWIYLVGPVVGALVGGALYQLVRHTDAAEDQPGPSAAQPVSRV
jgi:glycerol uptake facilitator-like aquaporin